MPLNPKDHPKYPLNPAAAPAPLEWLERWRFLLPSLLLISILGQFYWRVYPDIYPYVIAFAVVTAVCMWYVHIRALLSARQVINAADVGSSNGLLSIKRTKGAFYIWLMFPAFLFTLSIVYMLFFHSAGWGDALTLAYSVTALFGSIMFVTVRLLRGESLSRLVSRGGLWFLTLFVIAMANVSIFTATFFVVPRLSVGPPAPQPQLFASARREAAKIDGDARLVYVPADDTLASALSSSCSSLIGLSFNFRVQD